MTTSIPEPIDIFDSADTTNTWLDAHCAGWREHAVGQAEPVAAMPLERAKAARGLQQLETLGWAWRATGDERWGEAFTRFFTETQPGDLHTWGSFSATQVLIDLRAWLLLRDCPGVTEAAHEAFWLHLRPMVDNSWDLNTRQWRQTMLGPEGHNWYLHGCKGLALYGLCFPQEPRGAFFAKTAHSIIQEHIRGHFRSDGGAREAALGYQGGSLGILWEMLALYRRFGWTFEPTFESALLNATRFLLDLITPDGAIPSVGDMHPHPGNATLMAALAAAVSGDPVCKWYCELAREYTAGPQHPGQLPFNAFQKVGVAGAGTYARLQAAAPAIESVMKGVTGHAALRNGWTPDASYLHIAAAIRGTIVSSHGHNEIFTVEVLAGGERFLGEDGCAAYGDSPGRLYDQSTQAHNCLTVDGREQIPFENEWRWSMTTVPRIRRWISTNTHDFFHGEHEAFSTYDEPGREVIHARKILFMKGEPAYWLVFDWLESWHEHDVEVWWHGLVPGKVDGTRIVLTGERTSMTITPPAGDDLDLAATTSPGLEAYLEERALDPQTHPCFRYRARSGAHCFVWMLSTQPGQLKRLPVQINGDDSLSHEVTALEVSLPGQQDTVILSHCDWDAELTINGSTAWGFLQVARRGHTNLTLTHTMADGITGS